LVFQPRGFFFNQEEYLLNTPHVSTDHFRDPSELVRILSEILVGLLTEIEGHFIRDTGCIGNEPSFRWDVWLHRPAMATRFTIPTVPISYTYSCKVHMTQTVHLFGPSIRTFSTGCLKLCKNKSPISTKRPSKHETCRTCPTGSPRDLEPLRRGSRLT